MEDWQRVIEERNRMLRLTQKGFDKNLDRAKIIKRRSEEEKQAALSGGTESGGTGSVLEGVCYWSICDDFIVGC